MAQRIDTTYAGRRSKKRRKTPRGDTKSDLPSSRSVGKAITRAAKPPPPKRTVGRAISRASTPGRVGPAVTRAAKREKQAQRDAKRSAAVRVSATNKDLRQADAHKLTREYNERYAKTFAEKRGLKYDPQSDLFLRRERRKFLPDYDVPVNPLTGKRVKFDLDNKRDRTALERLNSPERANFGVNSAALDILEETTRPIRAQAGAVDAILKGKGPKAAADAVARGLTKNKGPLYGDVLRDAGVPNAIAGAVGFGLDVAADPLTYTTFGTASVAKQAATKAAREAAAKAAKQAGSGSNAARLQAAVQRETQENAARVAKKTQKAGTAAPKRVRGVKEKPVATVKERVAEEAQRRGAVAARQAERRAGEKGKGITVSFAGAQLPGVTRATAKVGRGVKRAAGKAPGPVKRFAGGSREVAREFRPMLKPTNVAEKQFTDVRHAARVARTSAARGSEESIARARLLAKRLTPAQYDEVILAIEKGNLAKIKDPELRETARFLRDTFRGQSRARRRAGIGEGVVEGKLGFLRDEDFKALEQSRQSQQRTERGKVKTAEKREAHARGRAEVQAADRSRGTVREALALAKQAQETGASKFPEVDAAALAFDKARKARSAAQREYTNAGKQHRNAHVGARTLYSDAERTAATGRLARAKAQLGTAKAAYQQADTALRDVAERHAGLKAARKPAAGVRKLDREPPSSLSRLEKQRAAVQTAKKRVDISAKIPAKKQGEDQAAWLQRVRQYARENNFTLLEKRVDALLKKDLPGRARGYFPHDLDEIGEAVDTKTATRAVGTRTVNPGSSRRREDPRRLDIQNLERALVDKPRFSTDIPVVAANYGVDTARAVAQANLNRSIADAGTPVRPGQSIDLAPGDAIYRIKGSDIQKVEPRAVKADGGRYVALDQKLVDDALRGLNTGDRSTAGYVFDRATGGFKRVATLTPGFHVRNAIGDTQIAYLKQAGYKIPGNAYQVGRSLKQLSAIERAVESSTRPLARTSKTLKVAGKQVNLQDFVLRARDLGVIRGSGYITRELDELRGTAEHSIGKLPKQPGRRLGEITHLHPRRWMENREDLMRLATYKHQLDRGVPEKQAADFASNLHIDYGDLTRVERKVARRIFPFYTFSARQLPIHAKALATNPGKFANLEKARQELAGATGAGADLSVDAPEFVNRQVPFLIKVGGSEYAISAALPVTLLNELPVGTDVGAYLAELGNFGAGLVNPFIKNPAELKANRSFFFRRDIESEKFPLVAAPGWVKALPKSQQERLGVVDDFIDRKSGNRTVGWPGRTDYLFKQVPGLVYIAQNLSTEGSRRGQGTGQKLLSAVLGVRVDKVDKRTNTIFRLLDESTKLDKRIGTLNQRGINKTSPTPEYAQLTIRQRLLDQQINQLSQQRGDKYPLRGNGPQKQAAAAKPAGDPELDELMKLERGAQVQAAPDPELEELRRLERGR